MLGSKLCMIAAVVALAPLAAQAEGPMNIGSRLELFTDSYLIDRMDNAELRLNHPVERETVLTPDAPNEGMTSAYFTVFQDGTRYRMYYRGSGEGKDPHELTCTAESVDGIHWIKPDLGLFEFNGSRKNNIVYTGNGTHAFVPFKDTNPSVKSDEKYKAIASGGLNNKPVLLAFVSSDGYNWKQSADKPILTDGMFDSQNLAFWDTQRNEYVCYFRDFRDGMRDVKRSTSKDFVNWTKPEWLNYTGAPQRDLYTNTVQPYPRAPYLYVSFPKRFFPNRKVVQSHPHQGTSDGAFMSSRDGLNFNVWSEAFMRPGQDMENWTDRNTMAVWGILQLNPKEMSIYYSRHYQHPSSHISRMTIRTDGFASVHAGGNAGTMITKPFIFDGKNLVINYASSAGGGVRLEVQDAEGKPITGFELDSCPVIYGDEIEHAVTWKSGGDLSALAGKPVRLKFELTDADLYSIRFRQ